MNAFPLTCFALLTALTPLVASPVEVARTNERSLNDLIRELPFLSLQLEKQLRRLSAVQEKLYLHERRMRGEGLPAELAAAFSAHYSAILEALVEDRITEEFGRELLSIHRQLLERTRLWTSQRVRNEGFPAEVAANLDYFHGELQRHALAPEEVGAPQRTPVINGYQAWLGELIAWGGETGELAPGDLSRIRVKLDELERFEGYYKGDGVLTAHERELLHGRFLQVTRETIGVISR